jgi:hypothetical protein
MRLKRLFFADFCSCQDPIGLSYHKQIYHLTFRQTVSKLCQVAIVTKTKQTTKGIIEMKKILSLMLAGIALLANQSHSVTFFADNFEAAGAAGATKLGAPWVMTKEVFQAPTVANADGVLGGYVGGYYPGETFGPNAIVTGQGGTAQGTYSGKLYPDFDGWWGDWTGNKIVKTSLLFNKTLTAEDIAPGVIQMDFNFKTPAIGANASVVAFAKLLNSDFSQTWYTQTINLTGADWSSGATVLTFNGTQVGANAQFGFTVTSSNYQAADLYVDNVTISNVPEPSTASLLGFGVAGLIATRLRRRS